MSRFRAKANMLAGKAHLLQGLVMLRHPVAEKGKQQQVNPPAFAWKGQQIPE
jgi:hypothetical protein